MLVIDVVDGGGGGVGNHAIHKILSKPIFPFRHSLDVCADFLVFEAISLAQIFEVHKRCSWMNDTQKGDAKRQREKLHTDRETEKLPLNYSTENNKFPAFRILCVGLLL